MTFAPAADASKPESCNQCGTVSAVGRAGQFCIGCGEQNRGVAISAEGPVLFLEHVEATKVHVHVANVGQLSVRVSCVYMRRSEADSGEVVHGQQEQPLIGHSNAELIVELPPDTPPGRVWFEVETHEGLSAVASVSLVALPTVRVDGPEWLEGMPVVPLGPADTEDAGGHVKQATRWQGMLTVIIDSSSPEPLRLVGVEVDLSNRRFPAVELPTTVQGRTEVSVLIDVDQTLADMARDSHLPGAVHVRLDGYAHDLVADFQVSRRRIASLYVDGRELVRAVQEQPGSNGTTIVHGLGRELNVQLELWNRGDLDVEIAMPPKATHPAVVVRNARAAVGQPLHASSGRGDGLLLHLGVVPDSISFESLDPIQSAAASTQQAERLLPVALEIALRDPASEDQPPWTTTLHVRDLVVSPVQPGANEWLFVDLGTTNTCVAYAREGDLHPVMLDPDPTDALGDVYPSLVRFLDYQARDFRFGALQRELMYVELETFVGTATEFKPDIGAEPQAARYYVDERKRAIAVTPREAALVYLRHVLGEIKRLYLSSIPSVVYLSYPISFNDQDQRVLERLVQEALGYDGVVANALNSEPLAILATLLYAQEGISLEVGHPRVFAVFDFGGGTTDILITRVLRSEEDEESVEVLAHDVEGRGGEALTRELARALWPSVREHILSEMGVSDGDPAARIVDSFVPPRADEQLTSLEPAHQELYRSLLRTADLVKVHFAELREAAGKRAAPVDQTTTNVPFKVKADGKTLTAHPRLEDLFVLDVVERVVDDFVGPLLDRLLRLEQRLVSTKGNECRVDTVVLAGNSSRLVRVHELAAQRFGDERVRFAGHRFAKEGVAMGLAYRVLRGVFVAEDSTDEAEPPYAIMVRNRLSTVGECCCTKLTRGQQVRAYALDGLGQVREPPAAVFDMREVIQRNVEKLCLQLRTDTEGLALYVFEAGAEHSCRDGSQLRAVVRSD